MKNIFAGLEQLEEQDSKILKPPFGYAGAKTRLAKEILPLLPYRKCYVEPFGGSGAVLLARRSSPMEVYNDRYSGVVDFYRCLRNPTLQRKLVEWIELTLHSREDFITCKITWKNTDDPVERAGRWLYMMQYSFGSLGRNFGRTTGLTNSISGKLRNRVPELPYIHQRLKRVQIENQSWEQCMDDYDSPDTVFYIDPPYVDTPKAYEHVMTQYDHSRLLSTIFACDGFVAVSGYSCAMYENQDWDHRYEFPVRSAICKIGDASNNKAGQGYKETKVNEILWIKESK